jgi:uncharacterized protein Yka (UPF0111/DUF47 family)
MQQNVGIIETAIEANKELQKLVKGQTERIKRIRALERESDAKAFRLSSAISSGVVSPNVIDDMLTLINLEDNIVDSVYNLARETLRYRIPDRKTKEMLQNSVMAMLEMADSALQIMKMMFSSDDIVRIKKFRREIEVLEQKGDEIKDSLLDNEYKDRMTYKTFLHIEEVAHKADDILDSCEDSADMFLSIMLSIMT